MFLHNHRGVPWNGPLHSAATEMPEMDELDSFITETAWPETEQMDNIHDILNHVVKRCMEQFPALQERANHVEGARLALHALDELDLFEPHIGDDVDFYQAALLAAFLGRQ